MSGEFFWSCAENEPLGRVSRALGVPETFCIEVSTHGWEDEGRVMDELARAFSVSDSFGRNWDAVTDCLAEVRASRPDLVVVFRDIPESEAARLNLARAAQLVEPGTVVLDGWKKPGIELPFVDATRVVPVRILKTS